MCNEVSKVITEIRAKVPLVQAITNYVTINDCANILLSFGASPAMVEAYDESYDFAQISNGVYINTGTLTKEQEAAAVMAAISAKGNNVSLVVDPVGCGAIKRKVEVIEKIALLGKIDVIKGNGGEIKFLAGVNAEVRGVDSVDDGNGLVEAAKALAKKFKCIVAATGEKDVVTDGKRVAIIYNGVEMLTKVTGAGCMVGALCAAAVGAYDDKFIATVAAVTAMGIAGEKAYEEAKLPGSFRVKLMDSIYLIDEKEISEKARIEFSS
jgi:hydroxyethylthiazole kinase